jgi:hypothetical protein
MNRALLIFTGLVMLAFLFTFPTRDRRQTLDKIRLQVGAENAVSRQTQREMAKERARNRKPASLEKVADKRAYARGGNSAAEQHQRVVSSVNFYCNQEYDKNACAQWLKYCGPSCSTMGHKESTQKMADNRLSRPKGR